MDTPTPVVPAPPTAADTAAILASIMALLVAVKLTAPALLMTLSLI